MVRSPLHIEEIHRSEHLTALREPWEALLTRTIRATIFQAWEWNEAWWRVYRRGKRLRILLAWRGDEVVGIAPLYVSHHLGTPLRRLALIGNGASDYLDFIAADDCADDVCSHFIRHLSAPRGFDLADLQQLRPDSVLRTQIERHGRPYQLRDQEPCPFVPLPDMWDDYATRLGKKMRTNLSYYDRLLPRTFEGAEVRLAEPHELPEAMEAFFELHQKRWNAALLPGVMGGRRVQDFHRLAAERLAERGWLRLHITRVEGRIVAALYCFSFGDRYYYYLGGFAPDLAKYSLGTVLTAHAIRQAIAEGCAEFDFLRGDESYKQRWMPESRTNARLLLFRPRSLRSSAMLRLNRFESYVERRAKAFAAKRKGK